MASSPLPPHEDTGIGSSPDTKSANTLTLDLPELWSLWDQPGQTQPQRTNTGPDSENSQTASLCCTTCLLQARTCLLFSQPHFLCFYSSSSKGNWVLFSASTYIPGLHAPRALPAQPGSFPTSTSIQHLLSCIVKSLSRVWLWNPMVCSLPGSSLHGILQAWILEWVAISFSMASSPSRDPTQVSRIPGRRFNLWATRVAETSKPRLSWPFPRHLS